MISMLLTSRKKERKKERKIWKKERWIC